jgi:glycerate 2-kinase
VSKDSRLSVTDLEKAARAIFFETLKAVDLTAAIHRRVRLEGERLWLDEQSYDLSRYAEVILIGIGKASLPMGHAIESILGSHLTRGLLVTNRRAPLSVKSEIIVAGHPVPNADSLRAGKRAVEILTSASAESLVIFLISGGGSSLFEVPLSDEITLEDLQQLNRILVECGATIEEINFVRKRFSAVKGGKLIKWTKAAEAVALLASDVNTGDLKTLASNLIFPEDGSAERFQAIQEKYDLAARSPRLFQTNWHLSSAETVPESQCITRVKAILVAENADVVKAAEVVAHKWGYAVMVDRPDDEEPYPKTAARLIATISELKRAKPAEKVCVISGGEVSCPVKGRGFGGRNQEFALYCAMQLKQARLTESIVLSCGTDGIDGRSIAVGAIAQASQSAGDEQDDLPFRPYFETSDTASWFSASGGLIVTGPTGNNLRDLRIILSH